MNECQSLRQTARQTTSTPNDNEWRTESYDTRGTKIQPTWIAMIRMIQERCRHDFRRRQTEAGTTVVPTGGRRGNDDAQAPSSGRR